MTVASLELPDAALQAFCRKWKIRELALFGSVLRDDFRSDSDIDLLATFDDDASWTLWDITAAEEELKGIFGRPVDLVERHTIETSENWIRRRNILNSARTIYAG